MADMIQQGAHGCSEEAHYARPQDPLIRERLEWFQDQKLALMMHFGPYAQMGIDASWALSDGDAEWSRDIVDWETDSVAFRKQYVDLNKSFNPICFNPDEWAEITQSGNVFFFSLPEHNLI